jgi:hypothetical protein
MQLAPYFDLAGSEFKMHNNGILYDSIVSAFAMYDERFFQNFQKCI